MRLMVSALEPSGCALGAGLVRELASLRPEIACFGLGDEAMAAAGMELLEVRRPEASIWLFSVLGKVPQYLALLRGCYQAMDREKPDALVVIDSSGFHFYLAKAAAARGIPVIYYVSPQIWAYNSERIAKIRRWVDKLLVLYPFEETYYRERGVEAAYVGHPLFSAPVLEAALEVDLSGPGRLVGILPGSRQGEIRKLLPMFVEVAVALRAQCDDLRFAVSVARPAYRPLIASLVPDEGFQLVEGGTASIFKQSVLVLQKSGTTTLEALIHTTPSVVAYRISAFESLLARPWIEAPFIALPNLFAGEEVLPEFLLHGPETGKILEAALGLLQSEEALARIHAKLRELRRPFEARPDASRAAAQEVVALLERRTPRVG